MGRTNDAIIYGGRVQLFVSGPAKAAPDLSPDPMTYDVLLFCERKKWHGRSVVRALAARGIRPLTVSLAACGLTTERRTGLAIPGLGDHLPRGALVLFVPGG